MKKLLIVALSATSMTVVAAPAAATVVKPTAADMNAVCTAQIPDPQRTRAKNRFYGVAQNITTFEVSRSAPAIENYSKVVLGADIPLMTPVWAAPFGNAGNDRQAFKVEFYTESQTAGYRESWDETVTITKRYDFTCATYNGNNNLVGPEFQNYTGSSATWTETESTHVENEVAPQIVALDPWVRTSEGPVPICQERKDFIGQGRDKVETLVYVEKEGYSPEFGACDVDMIDTAEDTPFPAAG